jgi:ABC-type uncharacterized transport system substrate-binding protein
VSEEGLFSTLDDLLDSCDVLLAVPDSMIYSNLTIRNIILSSYRSHIPLIGLSQAYVNAGAVGAVYAAQKQITDQVAEVILSFQRNGKLPEPQYTRDFTISLNPEVARSLGIGLPQTETVRKMMDDAKRESP